MNKILRIFIMCLAGSSVISIILFTDAQTQQSGESPVYSDLHICSMHPHITREGPGECSECGMALSKLDNHAHSTPIPPLSDIFVSPDNPMYVREGAGKDPDTGTKLIPIIDSPFYQPDARETQPQPSQTAGHMHSEQSEQTLYTCGMHPEVIQDEPGICPICNMELTPLKRQAYSGNQAVEGAVHIDPITVQNIGITTALVEEKDITRQIKTDGIVAIAEDREYRINLKVSGWIETLHVSLTGSRIQKGDPLVDIYSPELIAAQEEYLIALRNFEVISSNTGASLTQTSSQLLKAARQKLDYLDISQSQINRLNQSGSILQNITFYSPVSGTVIHKNGVEGAAIQAGDDLFRIADLDTVWVKAQLYEYEIPWIKVFNDVEIISYYSPEPEIHGRVDFIYPFIDELSRTATTRIIVPNEKLSLLPGMYVDVLISSATVDNALVVPKNSVLRSGRRDMVFIALGKGQFLPREVKVGLETDYYFQILEGLDFNEEVVTGAQFLLDSESKLQDAVQRRLNMRQSSKGMTQEEGQAGMQH